MLTDVGETLDTPALGKNSLYSSDFKLQNLCVPVKNTMAVYNRSYSTAPWESIRSLLSRDL